MSIARKLIGTTDASSATYVEDVFNTYLFTGTGASQTINNGIDLATKGGMVWIKCRQEDSHKLYDTVRGVNNRLSSNSSAAQATDTALSAFSSNGYTDSAGWFTSNTVASWTFAKQPKFFDVVTWTGNGTSTRQIAHALGSQPGMVIYKATSESSDWVVLHRSANTNVLKLNTQAAGLSIYGQYNSRFTSTYFEANKNNATYDEYSTNKNGVTYVAYLFAHDAGGFGPAGTDSVVACGSYSTDGSGNLNPVTLGWEPQFVLVKNSSSISGWSILDNMRGFSLTNQQELIANSATAEISNSGTQYVFPTATGFSGSGNYFGANATGIYLAIRRGPMKTPTDATKVFAPVAYTGTGSGGRSVSTTVQPDSVWWASRNGTSYTSKYAFDRLRGISVSGGAANAGGNLAFNIVDPENANSLMQIDQMNNTSVRFGPTAYYGFDASSLPGIMWSFTRAPGFFDVVCYTGTGANRTVAHNLGVAPELWIVKSRSLFQRWAVGSSSLGSFAAELQQTLAPYDAGGAYFGNGTTYTAPSSSVITLATHIALNASGSTYVAYLFATCPGVSKVGSYTGSGTTKQIDCGFTAGARFVLIKRTDSTGDWYVWDSSRGIVSGNDPYLLLNSTAAEVTNTDYIDPYSAGFEISSTAPAEINASGGSFVFLAIA